MNIIFNYVFNYNTEYKNIEYGCRQFEKCNICSGCILMNIYTYYDLHEPYIKKFENFVNNIKKQPKNIKKIFRTLEFTNRNNITNLFNLFEDKKYDELNLWYFLFKENEKYTIKYFKRFISIFEVKIESHRDNIILFILYTYLYKNDIYETHNLSNNELKLPLKLYNFVNKIVNSVNIKELNEKEVISNFKLLYNYMIKKYEDTNIRENLPQRNIENKSIFIEGFIRLLCLNEDITISNYSSLYFCDNFCKKCDKCQTYIKKEYYSVSKKDYIFSNIPIYNRFNVSNNWCNLSKLEFHIKKDILNDLKNNRFHVINNNSLTMDCSYVFDKDEYEQFVSKQFPLNKQVKHKEFNEYMDKNKHKFKKSIITKSMINGQY